MAAGARASSGGSFESTMGKRFQSVSNTMDSIQGLSTWCIDNKKYHSLIVRHWMKCLKKSDTSQRLNLFYVANDVIQNCKRKNAIVYRTAFAEMLPEAFLLVNTEGDPKVLKAVERILSIWEERGVYAGTLITELRSNLVKEESPPETPVEQKTPVESKADLQSKIVAEFVPQALFDDLSKYKKSLEELDLREKQLAAMRVDICSSDALKRLKDKAGGKKFSKDFEEGSAQLQDFVKFFDQQIKVGPPLMQSLSNADIFYEMQYKEVKIVANAYQTFANRVSHLKRKLDSLKANLPDMDESPIPSPSADAPSPTGSESPFHDLEMARPDPDLDGCAMEDEADAPAPSPLSSPGGSPKQMETVGQSDNREVEDMELSDEEMDSGGIIVEDQIESPIQPKVSSLKAEAAVAPEQPVTQVPPPALTPALTPPARNPAVTPPAVTPPAVTPPAVTPPAVTPPAVTPPTVTPPAAAPPVAAPPVTAPPVASAPVAATPVVPRAAVESVDLGKIGSILNSLNAVMKNTGPLVESPPAASPAASSLKSPPAAPVAPHEASSLVNLLSKVDMSSADILGALSKVQGRGSLGGISSLLSSPHVSSVSSSTGKIPPSSTSASAALSQSPSLPPVAPVPSSHSATERLSLSSQASPKTSNAASALVQALHRDMDLTTEKSPALSSDSLESKIHSFLQGNPAFNAFGISLPTKPVAAADNLSPVTGTDNQGGTPVRDEGGSTPTQDEIMDEPVVVPFTSKTNQSSIGDTVTMAPVAYQNSSQHNNPPQQARLQPGGGPQNGQAYQPYPYGQHNVSEHGMAAPDAHYQQMSAQTGGPGPGVRPPGGVGSTQTMKGFQGGSESGWYGDSYQGGNSQQPRGYNVTGPGEHNSSGLYPYQTETFREPQQLAPQQGAATAPGYFRGTLPPVPMLPPPPRVLDAPPSGNSSMMMPPEQQQPGPGVGTGEAIGPRGDSVISGMIVHDHQHKSMFHPDDSPYELDRPHPHPKDFHPHSEDFHPHPEGFHPHPEDFHPHLDRPLPSHPEDFPPHPDDLGYQDDPRHHDHYDAHFFQEDNFPHPEDPYHRPGNPPQHYPRVRGPPAPPLSASEDPYYQGHSPRPPHFAPRRPPPPHHLEIRHPGPRPPHRPPHPAHHPHPRGPPHAAFPRFQGPGPRLRGKRPGPRGGGHPGPMFPPKRPFQPPRY
ncbi:regulation of nuclear pre-mRNA domain-containing protein 2a isoform X1 [Gymnodraco acuticeps]|uniref:Regulation of nuclear pre-mRNA domain-containing protein 2 n=1 Tax=Gymnodraco acuticeps TaxID=8218 RepID=A0A6P8TPN8_GYMAC|nr:regulation of nuclear pre-mRNA domain-containing protein 2a isoform X1 [Gymnodraco acuticeps]